MDISGPLKTRRIFRTFGIFDAFYELHAVCFVKYILVVWLITAFPIVSVWVIPELEDMLHLRHKNLNNQYTFLKQSLSS